LPGNAKSWCHLHFSSSTAFHRSYHFDRSAIIMYSWGAFCVAENSLRPGNGGNR
jgi:hypothetical protein